MTAPGSTVGGALRSAEERLRTAGVDAPRLQATALLGHVLGVGRASLLARLGDCLPAEARERFVDLVRLRAEQRQPLQYLLGHASFMDFEVRVGAGVFIPRPETEQLVERALEMWSSEQPLAVDLCTGSGAIAIALARARPEARIIAVDVSPTALAAAAASARDLQVGSRIRFLRADLLAALSRGGWRRRLGLIVCNPPYATRDSVTQPEVRDHEPELAWTPGPLGTEIYARVIPAAAELLPAGRPLVFEIGYGQQESVPRLLIADGRWEAVSVDPDFQGIPRVLGARRR